MFSMTKKFLGISKRANEAQFSPIRKFVPFLEETKKRGIKVFELHIGQPDLETPKEILREIRNFKDKILPYTNSLGIPEVRLAWQKLDSICQKEKKLKIKLAKKLEGF